MVSVGSRIYLCRVRISKPGPAPLEWAIFLFYAGNWIIKSLAMYIYIPNYFRRERQSGTSRATCPAEPRVAAHELYQH